jgi:hypothetical protein
MADGILDGAIAGAAGTTALNAATYLDMAARGRPSSTGPEKTVEKLAERTSVQIPGDREARQNRVSGLGALTGIASGIAVGAALGALRSAGWRPTAPVSGAIASIAAMTLTDGIMSALGVTDPRHWSTTDWASDAVPHLAYGFVTATALDAMGKPARRLRGLA